jgi:hypothetical protein
MGVIATADKNYTSEYDEAYQGYDLAPGRKFAFASNSRSLAQCRGQGSR